MNDESNVARRTRNLHTLNGLGEMAMRDISGADCLASRQLRTAIVISEAPANDIGALVHRRTGPT